MTPQRGKPQVICITGSREWNDQKLIRQALSRWPAGTWLINGLADGADSLADEEAREMGFFVIRVPYSRYHGKAGGVLRNQVMAEMTEALRAAGHPYIVLAFSRNLAESVGTADMVRRCKRLGLTVRILKGWKS